MIKYLGLPISATWSLLAKLRSSLYDSGFLPIVDFGVPTISIGNIGLGGTGKTPFLLRLLQEFDHQEKICLLTRGYLSPLEKKGRLLGALDQVCTAKWCGDEACMIAKAFPKLLMGVGKNRLDLAHLAMNRGVNLFILDDGFQYRQMARTIDLVLLNGEDPFEGNSFFPVGFLRDHPSCLARATHIAIVNAKRESPSFLRAMEQIDRMCKAPRIYLSTKLVSVEEFFTKKQLEPGTRVAIAAGIARPQRFKKSIQEAGFEVQSSFFIRDHKHFDPESLSLFVKEAKKKGAEALIVTSKDRVKIWEGIFLDLPIYEAKIELCVDEGQDILNQIIHQIRDKREKLA